MFYLENVRRFSSEKEVQQTEGLSPLFIVPLYKSIVYSS